MHMNIALIGYGKMGKTIEALGKQKGFAFPLIIDIDNPGDLCRENLEGIGAVIEFTIPESAPSNILKCLDLGVPVVAGTTGWNHRAEEIEARCRELNGTLFHASNFSIGVNILFAMTRHLAGIMDRFPDYTVSMEEVHHVHKLDAPSGTAITLAEQIMAEHGKIKKWSLEDEGDAILHIDAIREGEVKGKHTIRYDSPLDTLSLSHDAKTRDAFASGALMAASYISDRKGVFGMSDLLNL